MLAKSLICFGLVGVCLGQWDRASTTTTTTQSTTTGLVGTVAPLSAAGNATAANGTLSAPQLANQAPVTIFFAQLLRGEIMGLMKCKKPKDCGLGLRCDLLLNLCVPFNTPILSDIEKPCSNDSECSGMHACQGGLCRFCGPKSCRSSMDCCAGSFAQPGKHGEFYECLNTEDQEKLSLAKQLGRVPPNYQPMPKAAGGQSLDDAYEVESEEMMQLGLPKHQSPFHGKRCWARCNADNDCYHDKTPQDIRQHIGCCNNVCTRKASCQQLSPQQIQQAQQLQQQRMAQQQVWNQQQAVLQQQQMLQGQLNNQAKQQGAWGAGSQAPQQQMVQQPQQVQFQFAVPVAQSMPMKPAPQSWQEAQQQGPNQWGGK